MALVSCPECSHEKSDSAIICPHCGFSVKRKLKLSKRKRKIIIFISSAILVLCILLIILIPAFRSNYITQLEEKAAECMGVFQYYNDYNSEFVIYEFQYLKQDNTDYLIMYFSGYDKDEGRTIKLYAVFENWGGYPYYYDTNNPDKSNRLASTIVYGYWDNSDNIILDVENVINLMGDNMNL